MRGAFAFLVITFVGALGAAVEYDEAAAAILVFWLLGALGGTIAGVLLEAPYRRWLRK